jgi:hypothetical protein
MGPDGGRPSVVRSFAFTALVSMGSCARFNARWRSGCSFSFKKNAFWNSPTRGHWHPRTKARATNSDKLPLIHYLCIVLIFAIRLSFVDFQDTKVVFLSKGGPTITNLIMDVFRVFCYRLCF